MKKKYRQTFKGAYNIEGIDINRTLKGKFMTCLNL